MTERRKQDKGRSEGDENTLEGRDIKADAVAGTGNEHVSGAFGDERESSTDASHVARLLERAKKHGPSKAPEG